MVLLVIGVNYDSASLAIREDLARKKELINSQIDKLLASSKAQEAVSVFTCNRTEIYFVAPSSLALIDWFKHEVLSNANLWDKSCYVLYASQAIQHIMRVASGLDSMVLGENQILGQLRLSYAQAQELAWTGKILSKLFQTAFAIAKQVRSETKIGENAISVAYIAVQMAKMIFADISVARVFIIGAGDTAKLLIQNLLNFNVTDICIVNRSKVKAIALAQSIEQEFAWKFLALSSLPDNLGYADIVISSTASKLPIIGKGMVERAVVFRKHKPLLLIDLAMPRDIESEVANLSDVYLYSLDDLKDTANENKRTRLKQADIAEKIVKHKAQEFNNWLNSSDVVSAMVGMRGEVWDIAQKCLKKSEKLLNAGEDPKKVLKHLTWSLTQKMLHFPTVKMKDMKDRKFIEKINQLFNLNEVDVSAKKHEEVNS